MARTWSRRVLVARLRRRGIRPHRYRGQRYTTVMAKRSKGFVDETLWPEIEALSSTLRSCLDEVTNRVVGQGIHSDVSEGGEVEEPKQLPLEVAAGQTGTPRTLLLRHYNTVNDALAAGEPFVPPPTDEDAVHDWCAGYMSGVDLDHAWNDDTEAIATLFPIAVLAGETPLNAPTTSTRSRTRSAGCARHVRTSTGWSSTPARCSPPPDARSLEGRRCNAPSGEARRSAATIRVRAGAARSTRVLLAPGDLTTYLQLVEDVVASPGSTPVVRLGRASATLTR
ncbi:MAG TPA: UPF0149 family protein [Sandaracinaceae bacterium LLY-WYZ-13_1]|nr:UPF0149 family protein [Sandaracinaceae bacterium LLY-WYZ-13_1]